MKMTGQYEPEKGGQHGRILHYFRKIECELIYFGHYLLTIQHQRFEGYSILRNRWHLIS